MTWKAETENNTLYANRRNQLPTHKDWCSKPQILDERFNEK